MKNENSDMKEFSEPKMFLRMLRKINAKIKSTKKAFHGLIETYITYLFNKTMPDLDILEKILASSLSEIFGEFFGSAV